MPDPEGNEVDLVPLPAAEAEDWRAVFGAMAHYPTGSSSLAADLVQEVAHLADAAGVPLLIDMRSGGVTIDSGKDVWEEDARFGPLAVQVQTAARGLG